MRGTLFASDSSASRPVEVRLLPGGALQIMDEAGQQQWPLKDLRVADRLPGCPAVVELADGARLEVADAERFYDEIRAWRGRSSTWLHALEARWPVVIGCLLLTVGLVYWFVTDGLPLAARYVAASMPESVHAAIGGEGMNLLDQIIFSPSELDSARQQALRDRFADVVTVVGEDCNCQLQFRKLGAPNALALPSGIVVLTDEIVALAENDDELAAVLAHEVGHVVHRHAMRSLIQNSVSTGLIVALTGDVGSAANFAAGLPAVVLNAAYSRDFEREADAVAFRYLQTRDLDPEGLGRLLVRIDEQYGHEGGSATLLDSHPGSHERLEAGRLR